MEQIADEATVAVKRLGRAWGDLRPEHFTFVMATGIVSTGLHNTGADALSLILFWIALAGYVVLLAGCVTGLVGRRLTVRSVLIDENVRALAFVAAGGVLAARMTPLGWHGLALAFIVVSGIAWVALQYGVVGGLVLRASTGRRDLRIFDGTWFLIVVSTQSLAVSLGAWSVAVDSRAAALLAALAWGLGVLQLIIVASLVSARLLVSGVRARDEVAPYWVFLGSGAISVLGAAEVLRTTDGDELLPRLLVGGVAMALWAFVTWMIPLTIALQVWQRTRTGAIKGYRPALWAMAFPVGMYGEATRELGFVRGTHWLEVLGANESWVAFAVWLVLAVGLAAAVARLAGYRR